ncbi:MAG: MBL fold metallo-hydrolase [Clostridia bacterium]|nr:MBL fold metallo-hydrolase [Clostridia bacterium]
MNTKITDVRAVKGDSAFLIDDGKTSILYDSGFGFTGFQVADNIKSELKGRSLDYIFLTHSHYDHALGSAYVLNRFKDAKIVAGEYAVKIFSKPTAKALMRDLDRKFAIKNGVSDYEDLTDNLTVHIAVKDGDIIKAGDMEFTALNLTGHTRCSVGYYLKSEKLLLSTESLGVYTEDGEVVPSYLVGYQMVIDSIKRVQSLDVEKILIPHYGVIVGAEAKAYLDKALENASQTAKEIVRILKSGGGKDDAVDYFVAKYYKGKVKEIYPYDAMMLNTSITVNLIEKELVNI